MIYYVINFFLGLCLLATPSFALQVPQAKLSGNNIVIALDKQQFLYEKSIKLSSQSEHSIATTIQGKKLKLHGQEVLTGIVTIPISSNQFTPITINFQGCNINGTCYPPQQQIIAPQPIFIVITLFLAGIFLAFTPCAIPIAPIAIASIHTHSSTNRAKKACIFLLATTIFYSLLGGITYAAQLPIQQYLQSPVILISFAIIIIFVAVCMLELTPTTANLLYKATALLTPKTGNKNQYSSSISGAIAMLIATPCTAPPIFAILALATKAQNLLIAMGGMACLGLGLTLPATIASFYGSKLSTKLAMTNLMQLIIGNLLIAFATILLNRVINFYTSIIIMSSLSVILVYTTHKYIKTQKFKLNSIILVITTFTAIGIGINSMPANNSFTQTLQFNEINRKHTKGTIIYFHAKWCVSCRNIEANLLAKSTIKSLLAQWNFILVDLDHLTAQQKLWSKKWQITGPPTIVILDNQNKVTNILIGKTIKQQLYPVLISTKKTIK